ncbi:putative transcription corepressor [Naematelia encephala]|uniref:Protein HIR n=1 Tax=Naematelia encephala TaxID=71784 RepID=A0A1Y2B0X5_9TREE|nr:putative transcription corepressor [Naematelia encephala]
MRITRPNWVKHTDEKDKRSPIYSISVHPDGTRLASGGLDKKVKIWSTLPILDLEAEENEANPKLLCTMSSHTGSVLSVRWAHHGRFLASGSDDMCVVIWGVDPEGGGRVFGSDEVNVENWKALTRLVGHTADIIDIAWSRDDSMLATVGLDKMVNIWDGATFQRIRKLDQHGDFVKGVTWDPVGNYLATQSDDKTVKIWDVTTWTLVHSVAAPFANSPKSTFFRRLSWSPDGAFIAASNAMNGPVFVAAVIEREGWGSDISFVGHENTIQVAAFNPHLFLPPNAPHTRPNASVLVALGADDYSISIWRNTKHKPLVVLQNLFERALLDLCWSNDGYSLYGSSADGTICAVHFTEAELPDIAPHNVTDEILAEFDFKPPPRATPRPLPAAPTASSTGFGPSVSSGGHVNVLQPRKAKPKPLNGKKRIDLSGGGDSRASNGFGPPNNFQDADAFSSAPIQPLASPSAAQASTARMFRDAHSAFGNGTSDGDNVRAGHKRKASLLVEGAERVPKNRTMGGSSVRTGEVSEIRAPRVPVAGPSGQSGRFLPLPGVQNVVRTQFQGSELEAQNAVQAGQRNKIVLRRDGQDQWIDYVPCGITILSVSDKFGAAAGERGELFVYSSAGRHLATLKLDSPISEMTIKGGQLAVVTAKCLLRVFNMTKLKSAVPPISIESLLDAPVDSSGGTSNALDLTRLEVRPNGVPIVYTSEPCAFVYDTNLSSWTPVASPWWIAHSQQSDRRSVSSGPLAEIELYLSSSWTKPDDIGDRPQWFDEAVEMGHLESRMKASILLDSKEEYRHWLMKYAGVLGREGFRERAEELIKDHVGPIYQHKKDLEWEDTLFGAPKRDWAKPLLATLASTTALSGLANHWQQLLRNASAEENAW